MRKSILRALCYPAGVVMALLLTPLAFAQRDASYPTRVITIVTPTTGGAADAIARTVSAAMGRSMNGSFVVVSRPGAGGNIASEAVAHAPADGYTLLLALGSMLTVNPSLYNKVGFNPVSDFSPIAQLATSAYVLAVNPATPAASVKDLVAYAKKSPQPLFYSSPGNGTPNHFLGVLFNSAAGTNLQHVPYKTTAAATTDVLAGQVPITFGSMPNVLPFIKSGKLRALAVTTKERSSLAPDLPTVGDALPGYAFESWYALLAPANTPKAIINQLASAASAALSSKDVRDELLAQGVEASVGTPKQLEELIRVDLDKWTTIVKSTGIRLD